MLRSVASVYKFSRNPFRDTSMIRNNHVFEDLRKFCEETKMVQRNWIIATQCRRPLMFQTMKDVRSNNVILKYQRFTSSGCKDIRIPNIEFVAKTQFLLHACTEFLRIYTNTWIIIIKNKCLKIFNKGSDSWQQILISKSLILGIPML